MSLLPWGGFGGFGGLNPYSSSDFGLSDPFFSSGWGPMDVFPSRSFAPTFRRMENELGRLLSSVKEDDKTFQVIGIFYSSGALMGFSIFPSAR